MLSEKRKYICRELSWLEFNKRVLRQAVDRSVPLLERIQFYAIYISNIDEYMMVRAGCFLNRAIYDKSYIDDKTGLDAYDILSLIYKALRKQNSLREKTYAELMAELSNIGVKKCTWSSLGKSEKKRLIGNNEVEIAKKVPIYIVNQYHPFPHLDNLQLHILLKLKLKPNGEVKSSDRESESYAILPIPAEIDGILKVDDGDDLRYIKTSELIARTAPSRLKKYEVTDCILFKITRNADIDFEDELEYESEACEMPEKVRKVLKKREKLDAVRLEFSPLKRKYDKRSVKFLTRKLGLKDEQVIKCKNIIPKNWSSEIADRLRESYPKLCYEPVPQIKIKRGDRVLDHLKNHDLLIGYPYNSFSEYLDFLREAVYLYQTQTIKITLYRLSRYSEVITLLKAAAERGIQVTAIIELKARFDEEMNANWAEALLESGCRVIFGQDGVKVHSKVTFFQVKEQDRIVEYAHIGTGNYNEKTAKQYTDVGIMTSDKTICDDCKKLFESLETKSLRLDYSRLLVSPTCLRDRILDEINIEVKAAKAGNNAYICMKMNSLTDKLVIDSLYDAAKAGVKIDLIVRGICCLDPGAVGNNSSINVVSIVGRYLEHSRIYIFGENRQNRRIYIGSADMMTRNTMRRIEVLVPIDDPDIAQLLFEQTRMQLWDDVKASRLLPNGRYEKKESEGAPFDSQMEIYKLYK